MKAYYLFGKSPLPSELNAEIGKTLEKLSVIKSQEEYLRAAYDVITTRFTSSRLKTFFKFWDLFSDGADDLWNRTGFLHCTNQNYLLVLLLVKSGRFKESDIKLKWTRILLISPHEYLQVKVGDKIVDVDAWGKSYGIPFGRYAHGFSGKLRHV